MRAQLSEFKSFTQLKKESHERSRTRGTMVSVHARDGGTGWHHTAEACSLTDNDAVCMYCCSKSVIAIFLPRELVVMLERLWMEAVGISWRSMNVQEILERISRFLFIFCFSRSHAVFEPMKNSN